MTRTKYIAAAHHYLAMARIAHERGYRHMSAMYLDRAAIERRAAMGISV